MRAPTTPKSRPNGRSLHQKTTKKQPNARAQYTKPPASSDLIAWKTRAYLNSNACVAPPLFPRSYTGIAQLYNIQGGEANFADLFIVEFLQYRLYH